MGASRTHAEEFRRHLVLLALLAVAIFAPTLSYQFVWDDEALIEHNHHIRFARNIPRFFTSDYSRLSHEDIGRGYYRPLLALSFFADYRTWGLNPAGFHLTNILLHASVTLLVYWLVIHLARAATVALLAAVIFALHPVHLEAVAFISARVDLLCTLGYLVAVAAFLRSHAAAGWASRGWTVISLGGFAFALLAKETALTLPLMLAILPAGTLAPGSRPARGRIVALLPYVLVLGGYLALRGLYSPLPIGDREFHPAHLADRVPAAVRTVGRYLLQAVVPLSPMPYYNLTPASGSADPGFLASAVALAAAGAALLRARRRALLLAWAGLWFFVTVLPAANLMPVPGSRALPMADRYLYLPSVGVAFAMAMLLERAAAAARDPGTSERVRVFGVLAALAFYALPTLVWSDIWRDNRRLYEHMVRTSPLSAEIYENLAATYYNEGLYREAQTTLERAIQLRPDAGSAYSLLGKVYDALGRSEDALALLRRGHAMSPGNRRAAARLGEALLKRGRLDEAVGILAQIVRADAQSGPAHNLVGVAYWKQGRIGEAVDALERAKSLMPDDAAPRYNLSLVYVGQRRYADARRELDDLVRLAPHHSLARRQLQALQRLTGDAGP
jgi:tetratricopeptide (TPR) repeat protein